MRILQSLIFYPRGGSAHVARALAREARRMGHQIETVAGSLGRPGDATHAETFYAGLPLHVMDYAAAQRDFDAGRDPMLSPQPFHPSYEPRGAVADRLFTAVSPELTRHSESAWSIVYRSLADGFDPDVVHMHHLTPQLNAALEVFPRRPIVAHLHGTELKMLELIDAPLEVNPDLLQHAEFWRQYLIEAAHHADHLIVVSDSDRKKAGRLLGVAEDRISVVPNGVDTELYVPVEGNRSRRRARLLRRSLVEMPRGSDESGVVGSVAYTDDELDRERLLDGATVLIGYVGRFTQVKRVPLLLEAMAGLPADLPRSALILFGGFPGEWEGEHPVAIVRRTRQSQIFFAGWHPQSDLSDLIPLLDLLVLPSVDESFGLVLVEALSSGTPVVAVDRGGPSAIVVTSGQNANGWLVEPDDLASLRDALVEAISNAEGRRLKGIAGRLRALDKYSWSGSFQAVFDVYERVRQTDATS
jgi:glycosyltransferase involved in cell wall biosynthesis